MHFPKWTNHLPTIGALGAGATLVAVVGLVWYYFTPKFFEVGYMPTQPGTGFSHLIHAGRLGMDCRYCHTKVEQSAEANIPNVATCYGCHAPDRVSESFARVERVQFIRDAYDKDESIPWRRVHKLPDYVRNFPHNVHINAGVSCYSCHGMIARMDIVSQTQPLSMGWCLECHADPTPHLVSPADVTDLFKVEELLADAANQQQAGPEWLHKLEAKPLHILPNNCGACHY